MAHRTHVFIVLAIVCLTLRVTVSKREDTHGSRPSSSDESRQAASGQQCTASTNECKLGKSADRVPQVEKRMNRCEQVGAWSHGNTNQHLSGFVTHQFMSPNCSRTNTGTKLVSDIKTQVNTPLEDDDDQIGECPSLKLVYDESGILYSLGYGVIVPYPSDLDCHWIILGQPGKVIEYSFDLIALDYFCDDYVDVFEGPRLVYSSCYDGTYTEPQTSSGPTIRVVLYTDYYDDDYSTFGIKMRYRVISQEDVGYGGPDVDPCEGLGPMIINADRGKVGSPGHKTTGVPKYPNDQHCLWQVNVPQNLTIRMNILYGFEWSTAEVGCDYDYLDLRDGPYEESPRLTMLCDEVYGAPLQTTLYTSTNSLYIKFHSDRSSRYFGFVLEFEAIPEDERPPPIPKTKGCGQILLEESQGNLTSPGYPRKYRNDMSCIWIITVPEDQVKLTFLFFELEYDSDCGYDIVYVYEGVDRTSIIIWMCGYITAPFSLYSVSNSMTVEFFSDSSEHYKGFSAEYEGISTTESGCGEEKPFELLDMMSGSLLFDCEGPFINTTCQWKIQSPPRTILIFYYETCNNSTDQLPTVYDGSDSSYPIFENFTCENPAWLSTGRNLFVEYQSDTETEGFHIGFWAVDSSYGAPDGYVPPECDPATRPLVINNTGDIQTPNFPGEYGTSLDCQWLLQITDDMRTEYASIEFHAFLVEDHPYCEYDAVYIYDGDSPHHGIHLYTLCGDLEDQPRRYNGISLTSNLLIRFMSDDIDGYMGFVATLGTSPTPGPRIQCENVTELGWMYDDGGDVYSPGFESGEDYPNELCQMYLITAPLENQTVVLKFDKLDVEYEVGCVFDVVYIFDGPSSDSPLLASLCGRGTEEKYRSTGNQLSLVLITDDANTAAGFSANYRFVFAEGSSNVAECSTTNILSDPMGNISSPLAPNGNYYEDVDCQWVITASMGMHVELKVEYVDIESHRHCRHDRLIVYDGPDDSAPVIRFFCGRLNSPQVIHSSNETMTVKFQSDIAGSGAGFFAYYTNVAENMIPEAFCGQVNTTGKFSSDDITQYIVGGTEAIPHSIPWQIYLLFQDNFVCGGSIVGDVWIVTAAHCIYSSYAAGNYSVAVGAHSIQQQNSVYQVQEYIVHMDYDPGTTNNDIALLKLSESINSSLPAAPVCIATEHPPAGTICKISGWGTTSSGGSISLVLLEAEVELIDTAVCTQVGWTYSTHEITDNMFCAGYEQGGIDACQGDSGGPLTCEINGLNYLVGVTSWGYGCASAKTPGIYTTVSQFNQWISDATSGEVEMPSLSTESRILELWKMVEVPLEAEDPPTENVNDEKQSDTSPDDKKYP